MRFLLNLIFTAEGRCAAPQNVEPFLARHHSNKFVLELDSDFNDRGCQYPDNLASDAGIIRVTFTDLDPNEVIVDERGRRIDHIDVIKDRSNGGYRSAELTIYTLHTGPHELKIAIEKVQFEFNWPTEIHLYVRRKKISGIFGLSPSRLLSRVATAFTSPVITPRTLKKKKVVLKSSIRKTAKMKAPKKKKGKKKRQFSRGRAAKKTNPGSKPVAQKKK